MIEINSKPKCERLAHALVEFYTRPFSFDCLKSLLPVFKPMGGTPPLPRCQLEWETDWPVRPSMQVDSDPLPSSGESGGLLL